MIWYHDKFAAIDDIWYMMIWYHDKLMMIYPYLSPWCLAVPTPQASPVPRLSSCDLPSFVQCPVQIHGPEARGVNVEINMENDGGNDGGNTYINWVAKNAVDLVQIELKSSVIRMNFVLKHIVSLQAWWKMWPWPAGDTVANISSPVKSGRTTIL